jgi:hypothetical protein
MAKDLAGLFLVFIGAGECRLSRLSPEMPDGPASLPVPSRLAAKSRMVSYA